MKFTITFRIQYLDNLCVPKNVNCNCTNVLPCVTWNVFKPNLNFAHLIRSGGKVAQSVKVITENQYSSMETMFLKTN